MQEKPTITTAPANASANKRVAGARRSGGDDDWRGLCRRAAL